MVEKKKRINFEKIRKLSREDRNKKLKKFINGLTLKQKTHMMTGDSSLIWGGLKMLWRYNSKPIVAGEIEELGIPGIRFSDGPRGIVMNESTCFPVSMARGASWDPDLEERIGNAIAIEARAQEANFFGGVCINLLRHPAWGRAQETYGEDPFHLGMLGTALVRGTQKHIMACAKHYACNSMENMRFKIDVSVAERTLREIYLPHFKSCVDEGVASIMNAYNKVNGKYCGHNPHLLRDILKEDWGFRGFVITDFMLGIRDGEQAVKAGVDIEMPFHWRMKSKKLVKMVKKGIISENKINDSVLRILRQQVNFSGIGNPALYKEEKIACEEHTKLALEAARKSIVLLKNKKNSLPLDQENIEKIAVLGKLANTPNIGDKGSSRVYPPYVVTPLEGCKKLVGATVEVIYCEGDDYDEASNVAKNADVAIIVAGYTDKDEGEYVASKGGDRDSLRLKPEEENLILRASEVNENTIVILEGGSAIITENWREKVQGILMGWYPGMEGGTALAEILFGEVNPSAKLPMVFPKSEDQLPYFDKDAKSIEYGYYHGYRLMDKEGFSPAFPFGYGLSFTQYAYNNLKIDKKSIRDDDELTISVDVTNSGDR
ncbi:MAG: glycoside hydrolase family 3 protein, partial [Promethearchaeia archaeon]